MHRRESKRNEGSTGWALAFGRFLEVGDRSGLRLLRGGGRAVACDMTTMAVRIIAAKRRYIFMPCN
jgi:hypothetical protein